MRTVSVASDLFDCTCAEDLGTLAENDSSTYEESRREKARLQEELDQQERALRDTRIRNFHQVEELNRAQEMRIDEFSRREEVTSQIQELQERMNFTNDSREFQDVESICSGRLSHVLGRPAVVPSPRSMLIHDQSLRHDTWNLLGTSGNVFDSPRAVIDSSSTPYPGILHSWNQSAAGENSVRECSGFLSPEVKNEIERQFQRRDFQGDHQL